MTEPGKWPWMVRLKTVISINIHCKSSPVMPLYSFLTNNGATHMTIGRSCDLGLSSYMIRLR